MLDAVDRPAFIMTVAMLRGLRVQAERQIVADLNLTHSTVGW